MKPLENRRQFLKTSVRAGLSLAGLELLFNHAAPAAEPIKRPGQPRLPLSLAAYSFRDYFKDSSHRQAAGADNARRIDMFQFIDFCVDHGCQGILQRDRNGKVPGRCGRALDVPGGR